MIVWSHRGLDTTADLNEAAAPMIFLTRAHYVSSVCLKSRLWGVSRYGDGLVVAWRWWFRCGGPHAAELITGSISVNWVKHPVRCPSSGCVNHFRDIAFRLRVVSDISDCAGRGTTGAMFRAIWKVRVQE